MAGRTSPGVTLAEILVVAGLTLLILVLLISAYLSTSSAWSRLSARADQQQVASVALSRLAAEARMTAPAGVSVLASGGPSEPGVLSLVQVRGISSSGRPVWGETAIVYCWLPSQRLLMRKVILVGGSGDRPEPISTDALRGEALKRSEGERVVAEGVTGWRVTSGQPLTVWIRLERSPPRAGPQLFELSRSVFLRNSL